MTDLNQILNGKHNLLITFVSDVLDNATLKLPNSKRKSTEPNRMLLSHTFNEFVNSLSLNPEEKKLFLFATMFMNDTKAEFSACRYCYCHPASLKSYKVYGHSYAFKDNRYTFFQKMSSEEMGHFLFINNNWNMLSGASSSAVLSFFTSSLQWDIHLCNILEVIIRSHDSVSEMHIHEVELLFGIRVLFVFEHFETYMSYWKSQIMQYIHLCNGNFIIHELSRETGITPEDIVSCMKTSGDLHACDDKIITSVHIPVNKYAGREEKCDLLPDPASLIWKPVPLDKTSKNLFPHLTCS